MRYIAIIAAVALAAPAAASASPKTPDGLPPGWSIGPEAQNSDQGFEFGNCRSRQHVDGPWVCVPDESVAATAARRHHHRVKAHAAGYSGYSMTRVAHPYYGVGSTIIGQIRWEIDGNLTGYEAKWKQQNNVYQGIGPGVRYRFYNTKWRLTSSGQSYVNESQWPSSTGFAPGQFTEGTVATPWWYTYQGSGGFDYRNTMHFTIRPATGGEFYSPWYDTRIYHCGSRDCHFVL